MAIWPLIAPPASAAPAPVRVLLPVYIGQATPGAYGSIWASHLAIHNASPDREYTIETICSPYQGCNGSPADDEFLRPRETKVSLPMHYPLPRNPAAGATLWLTVIGAPFDNGDDVAYDLRVVDLSRSSTAAGTEMPVVRDRDLRTATIHLVNIPVDTRFRVTLRVFEMNLARADFRVRIVDQASNTVLSERGVSTTTGDAEPLGFTPGFAEVNQFVAPQSGPVRIEIEPLTSGVAFWSYVSITNNDSQQITLVTPQ